MELVTKADLKAALDAVQGELLRWMVGGFAATIVILGILIQFAAHR